VHLFGWRSRWRYVTNVLRLVRVLADCSRLRTDLGELLEGVGQAGVGQDLFQGARGAAPEVGVAGDDSRDVLRPVLEPEILQVEEEDLGRTPRETAVECAEDLLRAGTGIPDLA
jgi:hypothetical protein